MIVNPEAPENLMRRELKSSRKVSHLWIRRPSESHEERIEIFKVHILHVSHLLPWESHEERIEMSRG